MRINLCLIKKYENVKNVRLLLLENSSQISIFIAILNILKIRKLMFKFTYLQ